ncbi:hypothetical protein ACFL2R_00740 [Patescibacteria group bacterium]
MLCVDQMIHEKQKRGIYMTDDIRATLREAEALEMKDLDIAPG